MSERLTEIWRELKIALKSIRHNKGQYASFFAALFLIQCFFGILTLSSDMNKKLTDEIIYAEYDYDIVLLDMNYSQMIFMRNDELRVFASDHIYNIVRITDRYHAADNTTTYDIYLDFVSEDINKDFERFRSRYVPYLMNHMDEGETLRYNYSEIYMLPSYHTSSLVGYVVFAAIMTAVSVLLMTSIYRIRVNHYKFTYGIYMSFGADYRQLCKTSFWEMTVVSLITFIPSQLLSALIIFLIYNSGGYEFTIDPWALLKVFIINMIIVAVSVCFPMRRISRSAPTKLISSEDNSNLVSSPRRSFNFAGLKFPQKYELASMWRFRRYIAVMLLTAVGFSSVFAVGTYIADYYKYTLNFAKPQITAVVTPEAAADETFLPDLAALDGVYAIAASATTDAPYLGSHVLFPRNALKSSASSVTALPETVTEENEGYTAANDLNYILADKTLIDTLTSDLFDYKIVGDPYALITDDDAVMVSNFLGNKKIADFKVGDKIKLGVYAGRKREVDYALTGRARLRQELKFYIMNYVELTVCAVIDGIDTHDGMPIYLTTDAYRRVTGDSEAMIDRVEIYVAPNTELDESQAIFDTVRNYASLYNEAVTVTDNHTTSSRMITRSHNYYALIIAISVLVLAISPLIWFFSQTLFVKKREKEFSVLLWLGTIKADIKKLMKRHGLILAAVSAVLCVLLSFIVIVLVQLAITRIPPELYGAADAYYFEVYIPVPALLVGTLLSVVCGYISSVLPVGSFFKRFAETERSREFDASDEN